MAIKKMGKFDQGSGGWRKKVALNLGNKDSEELKSALHDAGIYDVEIIHNNEQGLWVIVRKH